MNNSAFWKWEGKLEPTPGSNISDVITEAIRLAKDGPFTFEFNGVTVIVRSDSDARLIYREWLRAMSGDIQSPVGPYPTPTLSSADVAHDAEVGASNEVRRAAAQSEYEAKQKSKEDAAAARLAMVGPMEFADEDGWNKFVENNRDGYGGAVVSYAERWARLMQAEIASGAKLSDVADRCSDEADIEGITGFMYGCAVAMLAKTWKHGEDLRRWHNIKTQLRDEGERANESGGVLNPAMLNIG